MKGFFVVKQKYMY